MPFASDPDLSGRLRGYLKENAVGIAAFCICAAASMGQEVPETDGRTLEQAMWNAATELADRIAAGVGDPVAQSEAACRVLDVAEMVQSQDGGPDALRLAAALGAWAGL